MTVRAYAPASIGNFAAGFDLLGSALAPIDGSLWGDVVAAEPAEAVSLAVSGPWASRLPADPRENLVLRTFALYRETVETKGLPHPALAFHLEKNLPQQSGLGSSGSSVAATLAACQAALGELLDEDELLGVAGRAEGLVSGSPHLDNVAPSLRGGLQLVVPGDPPTARALPWHDRFGDLVLAVASPELELATDESRRALPASVPLPDAVAFAGNLAAFVLAVELGDRDLLRRCLRDPLAEPHRAPLVPGFRAAQAAALEAGALGCTLSGSGPATFALAEGTEGTGGEEAGRRVAEALRAGFAGAGLGSTVRLCRIDPQGARLLGARP
jgi:homoserine kinase